MNTVTLPKNLKVQVEDIEWKQKLLATTPQPLTDPNKLIAYRFEFDGSGIVLALAENLEDAVQNAMRAIVRVGQEDFDDAYLAEVIGTMDLKFQKPILQMTESARTLIVKGALL